MDKKKKRKEKDKKGKLQETKEQQGKGGKTDADLGYIVTPQKIYNFCHFA